MIDVEDLKQYIIKPSLVFLDLYSKEAENLILGTMAVESKLGLYLHQVNGLALGICQMEPNTHNDIWHHYLAMNSKQKLMKKILLYFNFKTRPCAELMLYNLRYAVVMCRLHYLRVSESLPLRDDIHGMAEYWKQHYNTPLGKGSIEDFVNSYTTYL